MRLIIGGYAQGKQEYVLRKYDLREDRIWDGELPDYKNEKWRELSGETVVINHFHNWVKKRIADKGCPEQEIRSFLENCRDCIIISDEIGNGIVPNDAPAREYRERAGRILIELAANAEEVERVICGIGQRIK